MVNGQWLMADEQPAVTSVVVRLRAITAEASTVARDMLSALSSG
jgi:hypothetical protein